MNGLGFILWRTTKNRLLELKHKPAKLVMYLLVAFLIVAFVVWSLFTGESDGEYTDILWLRGMIFLFLMLNFFISVNQGLSKGSTLFGMEDVNFAFVSPLTPRSILIYGVVRVMKTSFLSCIFLLFYSSLLNNMFGIGLGGMLILIAGYFLCIVVTQVMAVFIYSITNGKPRRKTAVKIIVAIMFAPLLITAVLYIQAADWDFMKGLPLLIDSYVWAYTPVLGWASAGIVAFITGTAVFGGLLFGLLALFGGIMVGAIYFGNPDYYEDVLVSTETAFEKQRAVAEGQTSFEAMSDRQYKVKGTGVGGAGASALFYKHLRESFRSSRFGLWGLGTVVLVAAAVVYVLIAMRGDEETGTLLLTPFITMMFIQLFAISAGRGLTEMYTHYVYMIPESPFIKMIWSNIETMLKAAGNAVLVFGLIGIIAREPPLLVITAIVTYLLFSFLLISVNYVYLRFTGTNVNAGILIMLYFIAIILIMAPGVVGAVLVASMIEGWGLLFGLGVLAVWELLAALVCYYAARGLLHNCDMLRVGQ